MLNMVANREAMPPAARAYMPSRSAEQLLGMTDVELANVDPVELNLLVAKGIPSLRDLEISRYQRMADEWAAEIRGYLPAGDANFRRAPERFRNDIRFGRLALLCWYVGARLDMQYREEHKHQTRVHYTDPNDLFLNGVMDTRRGTCGNMAMVLVALGWRLGWPVSLACIWSHFICRYDDGEVRYNIEATSIAADGSFNADDDEHYLRQFGQPEKAVRCGSELRALTPREVLGLFFGLRARHFNNTERWEEAEADYLLARYLFPNNRHLHTAQHQAAVKSAVDLFEPGEKGHPTELASWLQQVVRLAPWDQQEFQAPVESPNAHDIDVFFVGPNNY